MSKLPYWQEAKFLALFLQHNNEPTAWQAYLDSVTEDKRFYLALHSKETAQLVVDYLDLRLKKSADSGRKSPKIKFLPGAIQHQIPLEIWWNVLSRLDVVTMGALSHAAPWLARMIEHEVDHSMIAAFRAVQLRWRILRWGIAHCAAVIGREGAARMLFPSRKKHLFDGLEALEIFVNTDQADELARFLKVTMNLELSNLRQGKPRDNIQEIRRLRRTDGHGIKIHINVCRNESSRCTIFRTALTCDMMYFDGEELVVPHYSLTSNLLTVRNLGYCGQHGSDTTSMLQATSEAAERKGFKMTSLTDGVRLDSGILGVQNTKGIGTKSFTYSGGWIITPQPRNGIAWRLHSCENMWGHREAGPFLVQELDVHEDEGLYTDIGYDML
ncbi:hypothetical protein MIND_00150700 [Mycena indigotica]|uniref:Uncharacterized protein n=1 Tax=Mycena indigotica TaxID=2126181 RepID=A0A8H6WF24_9AGAR|nr:uncharacterized protein MIND_00150700 [Mycena indigotica]KAF7316319.1 hypothetical protein MIND_00150700 [Mycena indigotica]